MGITETWSRLIGGFVQAIGVVVSRSSVGLEILPDQNPNPIGQYQSPCKSRHTAKSMQARALVSVFGMRNDGRIQKEKARQVVAKLGLIPDSSSDHGGESSFEFPGDFEEVSAEEALGGGEYLSESDGLLRRAFEIFDENGNGFIEAMELKRVLGCLGLDCGWGMDEIEKMLRVVDLNLDGKVDFHEFELMMMGMNYFHDIN